MDDKTEKSGEVIHLDSHILCRSKDVNNRRKISQTVAATFQKIEAADLPDFRVDEDTYYRAIETALQMVEEEKTECFLGIHPELSRLLAWVWDPTCVDAKLDMLMVLDALDLMLAKTLIIGRTQFGRPCTHPNSQALENHYFSFVKTITED